MVNTQTSNPLKHRLRLPFVVTAFLMVQANLPVFANKAPVKPPPPPAPTSIPVKTDPAVAAFHKKLNEVKDRWQQGKGAGFTGDRKAFMQQVAADFKAMRGKGPTPFWNNEVEYPLVDTLVFLAGLETEETATFALLDEALALYPGNPYALESKMRRLLQRGLLDETHALFTLHAPHMARGDTTTSFLLSPLELMAQALIQRGQGDKAVADLQSLLPLVTPKNKHYLLYYGGRLMVSLERWQAADDLLGQYMALQPHASAEVGETRYTLLRKLGHHAEAAVLLTDMLKSPNAPRSPTYRLEIAESWFEAGDLAKAATTLSSSLLGIGDNFELARKTALAEKLKDPELVLMAFRINQNQVVKNADVFKAGIVALRQLNRHEEALAALKGTEYDRHLNIIRAWINEQIRELDPSAAPAPPASGNHIQNWLDHVTAPPPAGQ